ncbi:MAG: M1 family metallopeptidase [Ruminococcaceae bacterium]|nr:M1 family metallopeptidase [Oscillospiraceae bacterium]
MRTLRLTGHELGRLLRQKRSWLFLAVILLLPIILCTDMFGLGQRYYSGTMSTVLMLQPAKLAVTFAGLAVAIFVLLELQRMQRANMDALVSSATSPVGHVVRQTLALLAIMLGAVLVAMCALLPYTAAIMGSIFDIQTFLWVWLLLYYGGLALCILLAAGVYLISRSLEAGIIVVGLAVVFDSIQVLYGPFLLPWLRTAVTSLSDATGSQTQFFTLLYTRLVWLPAALGVYLLGILCVRRYGMGLARSFLHNCRKAALPVLVAVLVAGSALLAVYQPLIDNGPMLENRQHIDPQTGIVTVFTDYDAMQIKAESNPSLSLTHGRAEMFVDKDAHRLEATIRYNLTSRGTGEAVLPLAGAPGLDIHEVLLDGRPMPFTKEKNDSFMQSVYHVSLNGLAEKAELEIRFGGYPRNRRDAQMLISCITDDFVMLMYFLPCQPPAPVYTETADCTVTLADNLSPIPLWGEAFVEVPCDVPGYKSYATRITPGTWMIAGDYVEETFEAGGNAVQLTYFRNKTEAMRESDAAGVLKGAIDFFTDRFGPLDMGGQPLVILELDASVLGGWMIGNVSMFGETAFAGGNYKTEPGTANREGGGGIGTAVHEVAHHWWGLGAQDMASPWSSEGLTCYSTYLYMKELYGEAYARREFVDVWQENTNRLQNAFYLTQRDYVKDLTQADTLAMYNSYNGLSHYDLMPALLMRAEEMVGGEAVFVQRLAEFRGKYKDNIYQATYTAFLRHMGLEKEALERG